MKWCFCKSFFFLRAGEQRATICGFFPAIREGGEKKNTVWRRIHLLTLSCGLEYCSSTSLRVHSQSTRARWGLQQEFAAAHKLIKYSWSVRSRLGHRATRSMCYSTAKTASTWPVATPHRSTAPPTHTRTRIYTRTTAARCTNPPTPTPLYLRDSALY